VKEAEAQLVLAPQRAAKPLLKLVRSALANAKENELNIVGMVVSEIRVDGAPVLKRFLPRAQGRASSLLKRGSHVYVVLSESSKKEKFVISRPEKKKKSDSKPKKTKATTPDKPEKEEKAVKVKSSGGGLKKFFRRKSV